MNSYVTLRINKCGECPHHESVTRIEQELKRFNRREVWNCKLAQREVEDANAVPSWCPLRTARQP